MYEKEIAALQEEHTNIMKEIDAMEALIKEEKRDYNNDELDKIQEFCTNLEEKTNLIEDYKNKAYRNETIAKHRKISSEPVNQITQTVATSFATSKKEELAEQAFRNYMRAPYKSYAGFEAKYRDLSQGTDSAGGYLNAPSNWSSQLIKAMDNVLIMRSVGTVLPALTGSDTQGFPVYATEMGSFTWGDEVPDSDLTSDSTQAFSSRTLQPNICTQFIKVSNRLLNMSNFPVETFIRDRLAYVLGTSLETAYMQGSGTGEPLGLFTDSASGIPASTRDVDAQAVSYTAFCETLDNIDPKYHNQVSWIISPTCLASLRQLADGIDRPFWGESMSSGVPGTILGRPYYVSNYVPSTYYALAGVLNNYWIVDHAGFSVQRADELLALKNQVGFISRWYTDGAPVLSEAFSRLPVGS